MLRRIPEQRTRTEKGPKGTSVCQCGADELQLPHAQRERTSVQQNTDFKKKGKKSFKKDKTKDGCFSCGSEEHWANKCPNKYQETRTGLQVCQRDHEQQ